LLTENSLSCGCSFYFRGEAGWSGLWLMHLHAAAEVIEAVQAQIRQLLSVLEIR
jgi:hypothetical protein